jgi:predicted lipoprotein with Yx(FWY)xxD motif
VPPKFILRLVVTGVAMLAAACGGSNNPSAAASPSSASAPATVAVATNSKLGPILVDGAGRTLYLFAADTAGTSTCYQSCAQYWPPLLTNGAPQAGTGANASLLSTTKRTDGTTEVTYGGHPLYYVVTDHNPGDATGQAVNNFGALWFAVGPDGKQVS